MNLDDCFQLGYVVKAHGLKGAVQIYLDVDSPTAYKKLESVFIREGDMLVPFFIQYISINGNKAIVEFEDSETREQAEDLAGSELFLPLSFLPPLTGKKFYFHEVIGYKIQEGEKEIGTIAQVYEFPTQNLFGVESAEKEVLIPINDDIIQKVDRSNQTISVVLPEGLLDLYLS